MIDLGSRRGPSSALAAFPAWGRSESGFKGDNDVTNLAQTKATFHSESCGKGGEGIVRTGDKYGSALRGVLKGASLPLVPSAPERAQSSVSTPTNTDQK